MTDLLRFITCGSVDDGKSTLIGRLLHDTGSVPRDQLAAIARGGAPDLALLVDGLDAEREQGITIDVAYRFFATAKRHFIVADCPGHEQYTRNMATGASTADLAVVLGDARKGVLIQTRRHAMIVHLLGIREVVLAVTKMDLIGFDRARFEAIVADFAGVAERLDGLRVTAIPLSGLTGENVAGPGPSMPWYAGPSLLAHLENIALPAPAARPFRMPVQWVSRPHQDFRGYAGLVTSCSARPGDRVRVLPSGRESRIARIVASHGDLDDAVADQSVTLTLADAVDCARGSVIAAADDPPEVADRFEATLVWMGEEPMLSGRGYWLQLGPQTVTATVQAPKHRINIETFEPTPARTLELNAIGLVDFATDRPLVFEPYDVSRDLGGFILIDKITNATIAAGMIRFALRRSHNIHWQAQDVTRERRAEIKGQRPALVWLTGLSGAGKSTIANLIERKLVASGHHTFLLDGDNLRHGLNKDLGFSEADRVENIRRVGEVARLMSDAGLIVIAAFISPFRAERDAVRALLPDGEFIEVFVDVPLAVAEARDAKGLYAKARAGTLTNFTGVDSPYEPPEKPELRIDASMLSAEAAADEVVALVLKVSAPD